MLPTKRGVGCPPHFPAVRAADSCRAKRSSPGGRLNSLRKIRLLRVDDVDAFAVGTGGYRNQPEQRECDANHDSCEHAATAFPGRFDEVVATIGLTVQRSKAGNDHCDGHQIPRPRAAGHRVNGPTGTSARRGSCSGR